MAFRLSSHQKNGQRTASILVNGQQAVIGNSELADFSFPLPANKSIKICENSGQLTIEADGLEISVKGKKVNNESIIVGTSAQFQYEENYFYTTIVVDEKPTLLKRSYLSALALTLIWSLLGVMLITPLWLPYKITSHKIHNRNVLVENCSEGLDSLRGLIGDAQKQADVLSHIHQNIMNKMAEEVEQIAWIFRNTGDFMSKSELEKLEKDISRYLNVLDKVKTTGKIVVTPLSTTSAIEKMLESQK